MNAELSQGEILDLLRETGVLLEGHFRLTSGKHSPQFVQCAQVLRFPEHAQKIAGLMAEPFADVEVDKVVGPAMGGIILSYEVARTLGTECMYTEKQDGEMRLRRGFKVEPGEKILVVEDAVSTGGSVNSVMEILSQHGADIVGLSVLWDRTAGSVDFGVPCHAVISREIPAYAPASCPLCDEGLPLVSPKDLGM